MDILSVLVCCLNFFFLKCEKWYIYIWDNAPAAAKLLQSCTTFCNPITLAFQAPLSLEFSRQEYQSELPFPSPEDLPYPGIKPGSLALQADSLPSELPQKPIYGTVTVDKPRQHIKQQRHYISDKGLFNQSYGFSSSNVQM